MFSAVVPNEAYALGLDEHDLNKSHNATRSNYKSVNKLQSRVYADVDVRVLGMDVRVHFWNEYSLFHLSSVRERVIV